MAKDIFISHAPADRTTAEALCAALEVQKFSCWLSSRDPSASFNSLDSSMRAIDDCRVLVLLFSAAANRSNQVRMEVGHAAQLRVPLVALRIEQVPPTGTMVAATATAAWLEGVTPPLEHHFENVSKVLRDLLSQRHAVSTGTTSEPAQNILLRRGTTVAKASNDAASFPPTAPVRTNEQGAVYQIKNPRTPAPPEETERIHPAAFTAAAASAPDRNRWLLMFGILSFIGLVLILGLMAVLLAITKNKKAVTGTSPAVANVTPSIPAAATPVSTPLVQATPAPVIPADYWFRIHGSNTVGAELAPAWAKAFLLRQGATEVTQIQRDHDHLSVSGKINGELKQIEIVALGSGTAFKDLVAGTCEIGMASRPVKSDEIALVAAKGLGNLNDKACENVVGLDGIAIIVNPLNPVEALSIQQLQQLFSGAASRWSQVGGKNEPVSVCLREKESGTRDLIKSLVLKTAEFSKNASIPGTGGNDDVSDAVLRDPNAIGFVGLPYVKNNKAVKVSDGSANPVRPSYFTIHTEDYPLTRRLFLYVPANLTNQAARLFVQYALSQEGQKEVDNQKFVGLNVSTMKASAETNTRSVPEEYKRLIAQATSLGVNIRFLPGSAVLDNRASMDVGRILAFMSQADHRNSKVLLIGFADNVGNPKANIVLSRNRAKAVETSLRAEGIPVGTVNGFGPWAPVASNDTPEGREKNRRVEVWLQ